MKPGGKAQGTAAASKKLTDLIKSTGEFTVEVWANNANVAQEDAWLVSYSGGAMTRNFTLAQRMYQYEGHVRSDQTSANGNPVLLTRAADMDAQAALQHVVMTYSPVEGRRFYVNGIYTQDTDAQGGGSLAEWDDTFALVLGNETSTNRQWEGVMRLVAIHNRALTPAQIEQNFEAGVGEKYFMLFNVSHLVSVPRCVPDARGQPARQLRHPVHQADFHQPQHRRHDQQSFDRGHSHRSERRRGARRPGLSSRWSPHVGGANYSRGRRPAAVAIRHGHRSGEGRA